MSANLWGRVLDFCSVAQPLIRKEMKLCCWPTRALFQHHRSLHDEQRLQMSTVRRCQSPTAGCG